MKTNRFLAALLLCIASIGGCSKDDGATDTPTLSIDKSEITFTSAGNAAFVKYSSNRPADLLNIAVLSDSETEWCRAELHRNTVAVTVDENTSGKERRATIEITGESVGETLVVIQKAVTIDVPKSVVIEASEGAQKVIDVNTETTVWDVECEAEWIELSKDEAKKQFTVKCSENKTGNARIASVTVSAADDSSAEIKITQSEHTMKIAGGKWQACDRLQSIVAWQMETTASEVKAATDEPTWCIGMFYEGSLVVMALENTTGQERNATVTVTLNDGQSTTLKIYQGRYAVGDVYENEDVKGVIYRYEAAEKKADESESETEPRIVFGGNIVSLDETELQWATDYESAKADSYYNGAANTLAVKTNEELAATYPAIDWCVSHQGGIWYLPAANELSTLLSVIMADKENIINSSITDNGGVAINASEGRYLSSTEESAKTVLTMIHRNNPFSMSSDKTAAYAVRAICTF